MINKKLISSILILSCILSITACGKKDEQSTTEDDYYAINDTSDTTEEETTEEFDINSGIDTNYDYPVYTGTVSDADNDESDDAVHEAAMELVKEADKPLVFNVTDDPNENNSKIDRYTISINGKMITFPCKYDDFVKIFGEPIFSSQEYGTNTDAIKNRKSYYGLTISDDNYKGYIGSPSFTFTSPDGEKRPISECVCTGVVISGYTRNENDKIIPIALKGGIKFGSTASDILDAYGKNETEYTHNAENGEFYIKYADRYGSEFIFGGRSKGLCRIKFSYVIKQN